METVDATAMLRICSGSSVDAVLQQCHSFARELPSTRFRRNGSLRSGGRRRYYDAAVLLRNFRRRGGRRRYYDGFCFTNSADVGDWRSPTVPWRLCMTCNTTNTTATINRNDPKKTNRTISRPYTTRKRQKQEKQQKQFISTNNSTTSNKPGQATMSRMSWCMERTTVNWTHANTSANTIHVWPDHTRDGGNRLPKFIG